MKLLGFPLYSESDFVGGNFKKVLRADINATSEIKYKEHTPLKHWGGNNIYYEVTAEDALILKMQYPELTEYNWNVLGPFDDDEVKIQCYRCGGGLFSVSGHEWKTDPTLQTYRCTLDKQGKCKYDA